MASVILPGVAFAVVFAAVCAAYVLGKGQCRPLRRPWRGPARGRFRPVTIGLEYRNARGRVTLRKVRIVKSICRNDGRLYLPGFCLYPPQPRTFRVDRIVSVTTVYGEVIDTRRFLIGRLGLPRELCGSGGT